MLRAGLIAPDEKTFEYLKGRAFAPTGDRWENAIGSWRSLSRDSGAIFDDVVEVDAQKLEPFVTWGTSPGMSVRVSEAVPELSDARDENERRSFERALEYMDLEPSQKIEAIRIDRAFIGSCTNSRLEDLRAAARVAKGYKVNDKVRAMVVPGSMMIKKQAEDEGLAKVFLEAGFEWRDAGCSMCLAMNEDVLQEGERLRFNIEPQLRGPAGPRRQNASCQPDHGRCCRDRRTLRGC